MSGRSLRILVVDDEPDMCWVFENALRPQGYSVTTATTGLEALELLAAEPYAVAFIDAKLPDLDGPQLAAAIRQESPGTVVILISGYYYPEDKVITDGLRENLFANFVAKPFDLQKIRQMICQAMEGGQERR